FGGIVAAVAQPGGAGVLSLVPQPSAVSGATTASAARKMRRVVFRTGIFVLSSLQDVVDEPAHEPGSEEVIAHELFGVAFAHAAVEDTVGVDRDGGPFAAPAHARGARDLDLAPAVGVFDGAAERVEERDAAAIGAVGVAADEHVLLERAV